MQILTKEALLLLALSTTTSSDGLTVNEAVRALKATFELTISESAARTAVKKLVALKLIENGVRRVPANRRVAAEHYRLTELGRDKLWDMVLVVEKLEPRIKRQPQMT